MNDVIETLHKTTILTNADIFSVLVVGLMVGCFVSDGFHALIEFVIKKVKEKKNDKTCNKS